MSEVDIADDLPNGDDSAFTEDHQPSSEADCTTHGSQTEDIENISNHTGLSDDHVFVATSQEILTAEELQAAGIKTTHIVIHDQTLTVETPLKNPNTPLPPPTPATPLSREKGFRYSWDDSVHAQVLPVRCKNTNGELHKHKFGSGGRGRCIKSADGWYTPNEFEASAGRASSKDWKRSIRYGGRTLQCLIEDGVLEPHATSCTCAACCDDDSVTGPIRLFVPYKRRKRDSESDPPSPSSSMKKLRTQSTKHTPEAKDVIPIPTSVHMSRTENGETVHIVTTDSAGNLIAAGDAVVMTQLGHALKGIPTANIVSMDVHEQKQWWQLEEMANSLIQQAQQLKLMVEQAKHQSLISKEAALQQLKMQLDKERQEAISASRIEAQMNLSRVVMEERNQKEISVQQALAQARAEMQEKIDSVTVVADEKGTYSVTWAAQPTQNNIESIIEGAEVDVDSDKEKE